MYGISWVKELQMFVQGISSIVEFPQSFADQQ